MNKNKYTYSYPNRYIKTVGFIICMILMANATYFNDIILFNLKFTNEQIKKSGLDLDKLIDNLKRDINQELGGVMDTNCLNNNLDKLKKMNFNLNFILGTHKIKINLNVNALAINIKSEEEFIYTDYLNNKSALEKKINSIIKNIVTNLQKDIITFISKIIYVPKGTIQKFNLPDNLQAEGKYPTCFNNLIGKKIYDRMRQSDNTQGVVCGTDLFQSTVDRRRLNNRGVTDRDVANLQGIGIPQTVIYDADKEDDIVIIDRVIKNKRIDNLNELNNAFNNLGLDEDTKNNIIDNILNELNIDFQGYNNQIFNQLCILDDLDSSVSFDDKDFKEINKVIQVLVVFFSFFVVTCVNFLILALLVYFENPRTFIYVILSYLQIFLMIILTVLFLVLSYYKNSQIESVYQYLSIKPGVSGILLFVSTGLFIINKFFKSRRRKLRLN